jgi:hypothetical protein
MIFGEGEADQITKDVGVVRLVVEVSASGYMDIEFVFGNTLICAVKG